MQFKLHSESWALVVRGEKPVEFKAPCDLRSDLKNIDVQESTRYKKWNGANKNDLPPFSLHHSGWQLFLSGKTEELLSNWKFMYTDLSLSLLIYSVSNSVRILNFQISWDRFWLWQISELLQSSLLGFNDPFWPDFNLDPDTS